MAKWHYDYEEEIVCKDNEDIRAGKYYAYNIDTIDYLLNDNDWVFNNDAISEQQYIIDHWDLRLESIDGEIIYIPDYKVITKYETKIIELQQEEI